LAKEEQLDLPFSIKFKLMPQWVPTLWLALAFGLCWYLLVSRRRVLRLSARGLRLLQVDTDAEPAYVRSLVGEAVWWLAPLPKTNGRVIDVREFHRALGWKTSTARFKLLSLLACVIILLLVETRVFYIGFCVTSYLTGLADPALWIAFTFVDSLLFVASVFLIWRWFAPTPIPDLLETENTADVPRREVIKRLGKGLLFTTGSYLWITTSTVGFASVGPKANQRTKATGRDRFRRRKKHHLVRPNLPDGFYQNKKSGTVHLTSCPTCLTSSNVDSLVPMKSDQIGEIQWNAHGIPKLLAEKLTRRELSTVPGMAGSISHDANKESQVPTPKTVTVLHPHASHRTYMVEQHALDLISKEKSAEACRFLINVIEGTSDFGLQTTMRLFDLLAGISVRFNQNECSARLMTFLRLQLSQADARDVSLRGGNLGEKNASKHGLLEVLFQLANNHTETKPASVPTRSHRTLRSVQNCSKKISEVVFCVTWKSEDLLVA
jgi:hypothetical protein